MTSNPWTYTLFCVLQNLDYTQNTVFMCNTLTLVIDFYIKIKVIVTKIKCLKILSLTL